MNNKRLGAAFEREFCKILAERGFWVHFLSPGPTGGQPFDVIAVKNGIAYAFDCKTSAAERFPVSRLEENQVLAFEKWLACRNTEPMIAVKHDGRISILFYRELKRLGVIRLTAQYEWSGGVAE